MATVDDVLIALQQKQQPPADDRVWVLVEIDPKTGARSWTTHNLAATAASEVLFSLSLDLHTRSVQDEQNAQPAPRA